MDFWLRYVSGACSLHYWSSAMIARFKPAKQKKKRSRHGHICQKCFQKVVSWKSMVFSDMFSKSWEVLGHVFSNLSQVDCIFGNSKCKHMRWSTWDQPSQNMSSPWAKSIGNANKLVNSFVFSEFLCPKPMGINKAMACILFSKSEIFRIFTVLQS